MHWLKLEPKKTNTPQQHEFMATLPLLPNKYLYQQKCYTLALFKAEGEGPAYFLKTDNHSFFKAYLPYYRQRFVVTEFENGFEPDAGMEMLSGGECQSVEEPENPAEG